MQAGLVPESGSEEPRPDDGPDFELIRKWAAGSATPGGSGEVIHTRLRGKIDASWLGGDSGAGPSWGLLGEQPPQSAASDAPQVRDQVRTSLLRDRARVSARNRPPSEADYAWAEEWAPEGFCFGLVEHRDPDEVLSILVPRPETPRLTVAEARGWFEAQPWTPGGSSAVLQVGRLGNWTVVIEEFGLRATEQITSVSEASRVVVIFTSVNADMSFQWAVNGTVVRSFDPLLYDDQQFGEGEPLPEEAGLPFGLDAPTSCAFACAERLTGVIITQELLDDTSGRIAVGYVSS